jgi:hypothetical protein
MRERRWNGRGSEVAAHEINRVPAARLSPEGADVSGGWYNTGFWQTRGLSGSCSAWLCHPEQVWHLV